MHLLSLFTFLFVGILGSSLGLSRKTYTRDFIMLSFVLMVNKQGQTRLSQYVEWLPMKERCALESEIIRKCLSRNEGQCSFVEYRGYKVVYRRYASLFFIVGTKEDDVSLTETSQYP